VSLSLLHVLPDLHGIKEDECGLMPDTEVVDGGPLLVEEAVCFPLLDSLRYICGGVSSGGILMAGLVCPPAAIPFFLLP
jgi:hypothetical protein